MSGNIVVVARRISIGMLAVAALGAAACSSPTQPSSSPTVSAAVSAGSRATSPPATETARVESTPAPSVESTSEPSSDGSIVVDTTGAGLPIDPRIRGTNVPAWLGPETLASDWFLDAIEAAGVTTLRLPGGSWSNAYDWLGCELGDPDRCFWPWAARPADFATLLANTGLGGIWTVSINETAQQAAAAVAYFNGDVGDDHVIGLDRAGVDWGTTGEWARLRAAGGNAEPARIQLWEVGNEVYGGRPDAGGGECADFGWEDVWTCDGTAYVEGDDDHDGYLAIRAAMRAVDPTIEVGAVGVSEPTSWTNWGNEVIEGAGSELDFYVVHQYAYDASPAPEDAATEASRLWPETIRDARQGLPDGVPVAITEFNLVSFIDGDTDATMTTIANALFLADTIGEFASRGVAIANHWNIANGVGASGSDYGLVDAETGEPYPPFVAMTVWGRTGAELLASSVPDELGALRIYPTRDDLGRVAIVVVNPTPDRTPVGISGFAVGSSAIAEAFSAERPDADRFERSDLSVTSDGGRVDLELPAWSITLVEVAGG